MRSTDPRVIRTRSALRQALLGLVRERELTEVTMGDVAERAMVNRATIYLHYRDRDTLLVDAMEDAVGGIVADVARCVADATQGPPTDAVPGHLIRLFSHVGDNRALYARLLGPDGSAGFAARLRELCTEAWRIDLPGRTVAGEFLAGALVGVVVGWVSRPDPCPAQEIADEFWQLAARCYL
ncbi:MAG TPA: TetR/AcrR family transcriptional regulator [Pseudonocardiaceae bacterium]|nr:TetR/AcrR family transcriptional regulator [Pseudonocardiaceae bacterium]